ncbi:MAG: SUMF1/EgtB/PvdO family nonheme iron enzyme, partial [Deltaproteobacteria bacterium]|nr:SUMF1/EgtB/PvdO family nonheme iron enzyme [Deltaproteobacteria bacterium]
MRSPSSPVGGVGRWPVAFPAARRCRVARGVHSAAVWVVVGAMAGCGTRPVDDRVDASIASLRVAARPSVAAEIVTRDAGSEVARAQPRVPVIVAPPQRPRVAPVAGHDRAPTAGEIVRIPAGAFVLGSEPGTEMRNASLEPEPRTAEVTAFDIDRLPYPNDPALAPMTGVSQARAAELCAERGRRLCTEVEWERACKGPSGQDLFSGGAHLDLAACAQDPTRCASGFGVLSMGVGLREWSSSVLERPAGERERRFVIRGAEAEAPLGRHRCAARMVEEPGTAGPPIGFRCCGGEPNAATVGYEPARPRFTVMRDLPPARIEQILSGIPEIAPHARRFQLHRREEVGLVLRRGNRGSAPEGWTLVVEPVLWSPITGEAILVITGRGEHSSFIVALWIERGEPGREGFVARHAASMVFLDDDRAAVLAYSPQSPRELLWSMCWGCGGDGGAVSYRDDSTVIVVAR